jgi:hypothetical protein
MNVRMGVVVLFLAMSCGEAAPAQEAQLPRSIAAAVGSAQKMDGFFPLYWDAQRGKLWLEIGRFGEEFLYIDSLPAGVGSNDIGLDRGRLGQTRVVKFERSGPRVLLVQVNYGYRADTENEAERRAVEQAFAQSVLWGFEAAGEDEGRVVVDATAFFLHDAHDVAGALKATRQGTYRLEASRSALYLPMTRNFPRNTEVESTLTFLGDEPGGFLRSVTPSPKAVTVRQHYSFVQLPEPGYQPRAFHPEAGYFGPRFMDFATPVSEPIVRRYIARHRLQKKDPRAKVSEPVKPIVYYLDPGTPEPVRTALLDGARWWNEAFEAAGFRNAYRVEMLPEGADPMDVRYTVIQWVHRSTRGWSYGGGVIDPRTGEILKGHVTLGSLRVRQDYMIAEGLLAPYEKGKEGDGDRRMLEMSLARLRQLSAHEVGHTLGIAHNYIASTVGRASVMDYPHPWAQLDKDGVPDLSHAYRDGIGEWDKVAVAYGYSEFPPGTDEAKALQQILADARQRGLFFRTDQDARPASSTHPHAHLWDNDADAVKELESVLQVRAAALRRFGENNIKPGMPLATLEDVLVPIYLYHRYQTEAAVKLVGGMEYTYAMRGDGQTPLQVLPAQEQRRALAAVLRTIRPETLAMPQQLLALIPPRPYGYESTRELFRRNTGMTFDPVAAAAAAADHTVRLLLDAQRLARLAQYQAADRDLPGPAEVLDAVLEATWGAERQPGLTAEAQRAVDHVALYRVMALAANTSAAPQVRAVASLKLEELRRHTSALAERTRDQAQLAHLRFATQEIERFQQDPEMRIHLSEPPEPPPGAPIGDGCDW